MKNEIEINGVYYKILKNYNDALDKDVITAKLTDFYEKYDYIAGDWAYGKLRLKGFNKENNKFFCQSNDFSTFEEYINKYCAYGCKYFLLEKFDVEK